MTSEHRLEGGAVRAATDTKLVRTQKTGKLPPRSALNETSACALEVHRRGTSKSECSRSQATHNELALHIRPRTSHAVVFHMHAVNVNVSPTTLTMKTIDIHTSYGCRYINNVLISANLKLAV